MTTRPRQPGPNAPAPGKVPLTELVEMKRRGERIAMVTAYDAPSARLADASGADIILVGDSAAMVMLGHDSTVPATVDELLVLTRAVTRGARRPLVVADMPFGSFQVSDTSALENAIRFVKESEAEAVKVEGAGATVSRVRAILRRASGMPGGGRVLRVGNVSVDPARHEVLVGERAVALRAKEFELLEAFCRQPGMVLTRDRLLEDVWGFAYPGETRTVDVHVKQLRDKLAGADAKIETVWGVGYKMVAPST